jgi:hypothetical protein
MANQRNGKQGTKAMQEYIAIFGNGERWIFRAYSKAQATSYAAQFAMQNQKGLLCNVVPA